VVREFIPGLELSGAAAVRRRRPVRERRRHPRRPGPAARPGHLPARGGTSRAV